MNTIDDILAFNDRFVEEKQYEQYETDKYPDKKLAIVSCMDTRLTELLPAALGLKNGDAKIIKNAGELYLTHLVALFGVCLLRYSNSGLKPLWL